MADTPDLKSGEGLFPRMGSSPISGTNLTPVLAGFFFFPPSGVSALPRILHSCSYPSDDFSETAYSSPDESLMGSDDSTNSFWTNPDKY